MSEVMKIGVRDKSKAKFQFDDKHEPFEIDLIEVHDAWTDVNWALRNDEGMLGKGKVAEYGKMMQDFVQGIVKAAYEKMEKDIPAISRAEAEAFIKLLGRKVEELRGFFSNESEKPSSLPTSSKTEEGFSQ